MFKLKDAHWDSLFYTWSNILPRVAQDVFPSPVGQCEVDFEKLPRSRQLRENSVPVMCHYVRLGDIYTLVSGFANGLLGSQITRCFAIKKEMGGQVRSGLLASASISVASAASSTTAGSSGGRRVLRNQRRWGLTPQRPLTSSWIS